MKPATIEIDNETLYRIDNIARNMNRSRLWVIHQAVDCFLSYEEWFVKEVKEGMAEIARGEIASRDEVAETFRKWGVNAG